MRRLQQSETLHGTRYGQLWIDASLRNDYQLTERESAAAALLGQGLTLPKIAERLGISRSTTEKHLASLRKKLGVETTTEAAATVVRLSVRQAASAPMWGSNPYYEGQLASDSDVLARKLATAGTLDDGVAMLRDHLEPRGVHALCYVYIPQNVASFRQGHAIESWAAPARLVEAHHAAGGIFASPIAMRIFAEPDTGVVVDGRTPQRNASETGDLVDPTVLAIAHEEDLDVSVSFGQPFGSGSFVAATLLLPGAAYDAVASGLRDEMVRFRSALTLAHSSFFARGLLASTADLSVRERDALSLLAEGLARNEAAERMELGPRAVSELLKSARAKLGAATNAGAVARAMALNALVFF